MQNAGVQLDHVVLQEVNCFQVPDTGWLIDEDELDHGFQRLGDETRDVSHAFQDRFMQLYILSCGLKTLDTGEMKDKFPTHD